jgi:hypothetical protein
VAHVGVEVKKRVAFRDSTQEFSNIYYYKWLGLDPQESLAIECMDRLVLLEKAIHATSVTFISARLWTAGGTKAENKMVAQKGLSGTGSLTPVSGLDAERAFLIKWNAGLSVTNKPVSNKKWYHAQAGIGGVAVSSQHTSQATGYDTAQREAIRVKVADFNPLVFGSPGAVTATLTNKAGDRDADTTAIPYRYLEHHQLGDAWRKL